MASARQIKRGHIETLLSHPDRTGAGAAAKFQGEARLNVGFGNDALKFRRGLPRFPRRVTDSIALIPAVGFGLCLIGVHTHASCYFPFKCLSKKLRTRGRRSRCFGSR